MLSKSMNNAYSFSWIFGGIFGMIKAYVSFLCVNISFKNFIIGLFKLAYEFIVHSIAPN
jgi:hypothetical protein